jgi:hypothetical protein
VEYPPICIIDIQLNLFENLCSLEFLNNNENSIHDFVIFRLGDSLDHLDEGLDLLIEEILQFTFFFLIFVGNAFECFGRL